MGIKNLLEVIAALKVAAVAGKEISKDGIHVDDLPKALELVKKYEVFFAAVDDIELVIEEGKDIDSVEAVQIVTELMAALKAIKEA